jgi:putative two-component system response regulator
MGLSFHEAEEIRYAAPLHDIGKVAIPDSILRKPAKLTTEEFDEMKKHTIYGAKMLANAESRLLRIAAKVAIGHHEWWDGTGYPYGLKGKAIPLEARIVTVADVFDALSSKRVYKGEWTVTDALKYIQERAGKQFDPKVVVVLAEKFSDVLDARDEENRRIVEDEGAQMQQHFPLKPTDADHLPKSA